MKILMVGEYRYEMHEMSMEKALQSLGADVKRFAWSDFFSVTSNFLNKFYYKFQERYLFGPTIIEINKALYKITVDWMPDLVFIYRGTHIERRTIKKIKAKGIIVFSYNNDDPFSKVPSSYYWRHYLKSVKYCEHNYVYRVKNIIDLKGIGVSNTSLLRSYYLKDYNHPIRNICKENDVIFIGHFENDRRDEYLYELYKNGINLKVFGGPLWRNSKFYKQMKSIINIGNLNLSQYNLELNRAKIAIVFLSKHNHDTYTRRCFEIPAARVMMLSEYTEDLSTLFKENEEIVFFRSKEDLLGKTKEYLGDDLRRDEIAENGYLRVIRDKHEISYRAEDILKQYELYKDRYNSKPNIL